MRIAFDMSSVLWTCLKVGKSVEGFKTAEDVWVNNWEYGYENAVNSIVSDLLRFRLAPKDMIMVFEGKQSKRRRLMIDTGYKAGRGHANEEYEQFEKARATLERTFGNLGACAVVQDYAEGDDTLAWLAKHSEDDLIISTGDGDGTALNTEANEYGARISVLFRDDFERNKYGPFPCKFISVYKALVGDTADKIKGCKGFGDKSWIKFYAEFEDEGIQILQDLLETGNLDSLAEDAQESKLAKMIYDQQADVIKSYRVAKLRPEWVNTRSDPLQWTPGMAYPAPAAHPDQRLAQWYGRQTLVTAENFSEVAAWAQPILAATPYPGLDIETSTSQESDDWIATRLENSTGRKKVIVDVIDSKLTGLSVTFGGNLQHSLYFSVDHAETNNIDSLALRDFIESFDVCWVIQNAGGFELPVLSLNWGADRPIHQRFLKRCRDTRIEANYFNENMDEFGLKAMSRDILGYEQVSYEKVTTVTYNTLIGPVEPPEWWQSGGKVLSDDEGIVTKQFKMNELTAAHVLSYGCDDTITCSALGNFFKLQMELDHHWQVYLDVEPDALYLGAQSFVEGVPVDQGRLKALTEEDEREYQRAWAIFREYLVANNWEGTVPPTYVFGITAAQVKEAYEIVAGCKLETKDRKIEKLAGHAKAAGQELFAQLLMVGNFEAFTELVRSRFTGEPEWKMSPQKKTKVLYEMMGLPVRWRNELTEKMALEGQTEGNPKTDHVAIEFALKFDVAERPEIKPVLEALKDMQIVETRKGLYWKPYPYLIHWKTGRLHPQIRQTTANTERDTAADPNVQQISKHPKVEGGETPKVREIIPPHHRNAVVVSFDFVAQELREIAEWCRDPNMVACYVGDNLKDIHAITGHKIALEQGGRYEGWTYEQFLKAAKSGDDPEAKELRSNYGKRTNFLTEYGGQALKLSQVLTVFEEQAQVFIDAKEAAFPGSRIWKDKVEAFAQENGFVRNRLGKVRHLAELLSSSNKYEASKALRQAVNTMIQGSAAQQTKKARGAVWRQRILERFDCQFYFPVHDELVFSCAIKDLFEFIPAVHAIMVQPFGKDRLIPVLSSISFGANFGPGNGQIEIGEQPTREAIQAGLDEHYKRLGLKQAA